MICKKCNNSIPDNAKFCFSCGESTKAKCCPKCNTEIENDDYKFCLKCGCDLSKKLIRDANPTTKKTLTTVFEIITVCLVLLGLLLLFIACFTPMVTANYGGEKIKLLNMFYHFFYEVYKNLGSSAPFPLYLVYILSTIVIISNMLLTATMLTIGTIHSVQYFMKKRKANVTRYLIASYISTFTLIVWFANLFNVPKILFVDIAIAPFFIIVLSFCSMFIVACTVFNLILKYQRGMGGKKIASIILQYISGQFFTLVMIFASLYIINIKSEGYQISNFNIFFTLANAQKNSSGGYGVGLTFSSLLFISYLGILSLCILGYIKTFFKLNGDNPYGKKSLVTFISSIVISSLLILSLICIIVIINANGFKNQSISALPIICLVYGFMLLGLQIANKVVRLKD